MATKNQPDFYSVLDKSVGACLIDKGGEIKREWAKKLGMKAPDLLSFIELVRTSEAGGPLSEEEAKRKIMNNTSLLKLSFIFAGREAKQ